MLAVAGLVLIAAARGNGQKQKPGLAELAAVFKNRRPIEPRLTGGFGYAPCQRSDRAGRLLPKVNCSGLPGPGSDSYDDLLRALESSQGGEDSLHEQGVSQLITGSTPSQTTAAVKKLKEAARRSPGNATLLNDLAAAYLAQAYLADEPEDLVRALDTAARALEADPSLPEARFNLALALDQLQLRQLATRAWQSYLEIDTSSGWASEARNRLHLLKGPSISEQWKLKNLSLQAAVKISDRKIRQIVKSSPQRTHASMPLKAFSDNGETGFWQETANRLFKPCGWPPVWESH